MICSGGLTATDPMALPRPWPHSRTSGPTLMLSRKLS